MLKIDIDPGAALYSLDHLCGLLQRAGKRLVALRQERSGSGKGWHLWLTITPPCQSFMEIVALQAVCGSDRYREANNICRVNTLATMAPGDRRYWEQRWNVLYDPVY